MARRTRTVRARLGSIVLGFEALIVLLAALAIAGVGALPVPVALLTGGISIGVVILAIRTLDSRIGVVLGWAVQLALLAGGILIWELFVVGAIFGGIWTYCMIAGGRIDRAAAQQHRTQQQ